MSTTNVHYSIDGKLCHSDEYLALIEEVFNRLEPDVVNIELQNGEIVTLGGNKACVSILYIRHNGAIWSPKIKMTKKNATALLKAFIYSDEETLSSYDAPLLSCQEKKEKSLSGGRRISQKLKSFFILFLFIGVTMILLWVVTGVRNFFLISALLSFILAVFVFIIGGIGYLIECYKYHRNTIAKNKTCYSEWKYILTICLAIFNMIVVLLFGVIFPVYVIIFIVKNIINLLGI